MNGDKLSTLHYLFPLAMQHGGIWVGTGMLPSDLETARLFGQRVAEVAARFKALSRPNESPL